MEQTAPEDLAGARIPEEASGLRIMRAELPEPAFSRFLYGEVGRDVEWTDRLPWPRERWMEWLERPGVETWVAYERGTPAGYIELDGATRDTSGRGTRPGSTVEVSYFGLLPGFRGKGIGKHLLTYGVARAWDMAERWEGRKPTARVWLHTCSKDGPYALRNYQRRGFRVFAKEVTKEPVPVPPSARDGAEAEARPPGPQEPRGTAGPSEPPAPRSASE
ncbi:GNAT family N-acetyltransferase [Streptomyces marispadix]|uniref:GNAT family N-acetyltransferase n=1 Tax=Streptomyces marispadix TaxID=2922868 RepID=A0ABS9T400_9ACTN|nr:GNAT family N-acetyltransferase [Streptomyces marispadix]MCH6163237.1 GNAT family N-acetyltransferase [Streptomyces marispadix]